MNCGCKARLPEKAMIDETGPATTVVEQEKTINAKGHNEQWQRHLEKAYFERQRAAMQGKRQDGQSGAEGASANAKPQNRELPAMPETSARSVHGVRSAATAATSQSRTPVAPYELASGRAPAQGRFAAASHGHAPPSVEPRAGKSAAGVQKAMPGWRGVLPGTSSVSVLQSEHGAHLVIRDASLSVRAALRLLDRLRTLFAAEGERLWAVTLNGERLWQLPERSAAQIHSKCDIDRD